MEYKREEIPRVLEYQFPLFMADKAKDNNFFVLDRKFFGDKLSAEIRSILLKRLGYEASYGEVMFVATKHSHPGWIPALLGPGCIHPLLFWFPEDKHEYDGFRVLMKSSMNLYYQRKFTPPVDS